MLVLLQLLSHLTPTTAEPQVGNKGNYYYIVIDRLTHYNIKKTNTWKTLSMTDFGLYLVLVL